VHEVTELLPDLEGIPGVADLTQEEVDGRPEVRLAVERDALGEVVGRLHAAGVDTLTVTPPSLDDLFLDAYAEGGSPR
jgi:ABC-2 type transport system ATP-binding protein